MKDNYDFTQYVVSRCLCKISNNDEEKRYICKSCDRRLRETSSENPALPYYGNHKKVASGVNFLKSLQGMPTYVCTCCHRLMFHKNVQPFNISEYDMNHEIIEKSLSHRYVMKIYSQSPSTIHNRVQHTEEDNPVSYEKEYICIHCRNSLRQKKPKCLIRHVPTG